MWKEFRKVTKSRQAPLVWKIRQEGEWVYTEAGQLDGAMQAHSDHPKDKGKPGTKAYVDAVANAAFSMSREIRKKTEAGYVEYVDGQPLTKAADSIDWDQEIPKAFSVCKPNTSIDHDAVVKLHDSGRARYTRKVDGFATIVYIHNNGVDFYSRRMDGMTDHFPLHKEIFKDHPTLKAGTILVGEMVCLKPDGVEDFKAISRFCRSDPPEARKLVVEKEVPEPKFVIFDIVFHNMKDLQDTSYDDRLKLIDFFEQMADSKKDVCRVDQLQVTPDTWEATAKEKSWEGYVLQDGSAKPGANFYNFSGTAKRPKGMYKLKPVNEDDCVIFAGVRGTGKRMNGLGAIFMKQIHPETRQWFNCGKAGSGFTDGDLLELENLFTKHEIPLLEKDKEVESLDLNRVEGLLVAQIEFSIRQPGTNKFRFPVFLRLRTDKSVEDCVAQKLSEVEVDEE